MRNQENGYINSFKKRKNTYPGKFIWFQSIESVTSDKTNEIWSSSEMRFYIISFEIVILVYIIPHSEKRRATYYK